MLQAQPLQQQIHFANAARLAAQLPCGGAAIIITKARQHLVCRSGDCLRVPRLGHDRIDNLHGGSAGGPRRQATGLGKRHAFPCPGFLLIIGLQPLTGLGKGAFFTIRAQPCIDGIQAAFAGRPAKPADKRLAKA